MHKRRSEKVQKEEINAKKTRSKEKKLKEI